MSQAAAQATAFYREVARHGTVWGIRDGQGYPAPQTPEGRAMPFWSSLARVERVIASVPAYRGFTPVALMWDDFRDTWLPKLEEDGLRVGVNWTGARATGYDLTPAEVRRLVEREETPASSNATQPDAARRRSDSS